MFRKFRRTSNDIDSQRDGSKSFATLTKEHNNRHQAATVTFFDLPGELRNIIYNLVANRMVLTLMCTPSQSRKSPSRRIPGLLLASRQCRRESLPIILSAAKIQIRVENCEFQNLMRVIPSLYSTELKAMRSNKNLIISLHFKRVSAKLESIKAALRRWLVRRADGLDRLPWRYLVDSEHEKQGRDEYEDFGMLLYHLRRFHNTIEEALQWEMVGILNVIEDWRRERLWGCND